MKHGTWLAAIALGVLAGCASSNDEDPFDHSGSGGSAGTSGSGGAVIGSGGSSGSSGGNGGGSGVGGSASASSAGGSSGVGGAGGAGSVGGFGGVGGVGGSGTGGSGALPGGASCVGLCGGAAPGEVCWCDELCSQNGDCCADYISVCGGSGAGGSAGTGCTTALCNTETPSSDAQGPCYCDAQCAQYGDCCANKTQVCGS